MDVSCKTCDSRPAAKSAATARRRCRKNCRKLVESGCLVKNTVAMELNGSHICCFSPTGTSRRVAEAVGRGMNVPQTLFHDATHGEVCFTAAADSVAIFAVPVYGGHAAPLALQRMEKIRGDGTPAVVIVVYGNRDHGSAARELSAFVAQRGFVTVGVGAFVGEHSYSTSRYPIAAGRPDERDCREAEAFGRAVAAKLASHGVRRIDAAALPGVRNGMLSTWRFLRFVLGYRRKQKHHPERVAVETSAERCTHCGHCVEVCPTEAVAAGDELHTDASRCIRCCACVKGCPAGARSYDSPFAPVLSHNFPQRKPNRTKV